MHARQQLGDHRAVQPRRVELLDPSHPLDGAPGVLALSWFSYDGANAYAAAKAAQWSLTNGIRLELAGQRTLVTGLHTGSVDTDMMAGWDVPKNRPADVAGAGLDAVEADRLEVLVDEASAQAKAALAADPGAVYPQTVPTA